jgi:uncharacterized protein YuzE
MPTVAMSRAGVPIRLTDERWTHIVSAHPEIRAMRDEALLTISTAENLGIVPVLLRAPHGVLSSSYDAEADVLYITLKDATLATDSEVTDDDVIIRYEGSEVVGLTILHASTR